MNCHLPAMLAACVLYCANSQALEPMLPNLRLAEVELGQEWAKADVDGKSCCVLKAGATGVVPVPVWWGAGLRPAEGQSYCAQITFRDSATAPIKVEAFAGLPGRYELHRIGGLKDEQWKTIRVPIPWDMIMRLPGTDKGELVFVVPPGADVAFERITIVTADPEADEARWCSETRAWVARVQSQKRIDAKLQSQEKLLAGDKLGLLVPFVRTTSKLIFVTSAPQDDETAVPLKLTLAQNEIEPAQFGVYAGVDLASVEVSIKDPPKNEKGDALSAEIKLFTAEYSVVKNGSLFPQRLWPAYAVDIPKGCAHLFWITVETNSANSKPGHYKGLISLSSPTAQAEVPLEIQVVPIQLLTMNEAGLHLGACVSGLLPAHELKELGRHNHNSINLWFSGFQPKIVKRSQTDFDLDFTIQDEFMKHLSAAGIENFVHFLGGDPYGFPDTAQLQRELYRQVYSDKGNTLAGRKEYLRAVCTAPDRLLPELRPLYVKWVKQYMAHAQEKNWPEPLLTPFDEPAKWVQEQNGSARIIYHKDKNDREVVAHPKVKDFAQFKKKLEEEGLSFEDLGLGGAGPWIKGHFKDCCAAIHEAWPAARIYGSIHHAESGLPFLEDIEVFCTNAIHEDTKLGDKVRAAGPKKTFWQYSGTGDSTEPAAGRYAFGFFFGAFNSRGSLCWAYNFGNRFDTSSGDSWNCAWTTPYSVVRTPFWEGLREAWDDRRYIETARVLAKKVGKQKEAEALLEDIFNQAAKSRTEGGRDTVNDFWARTHDPEALDTMRGKLRRFILSLQP